MTFNQSIQFNKDIEVTSKPNQPALLTPMLNYPPLQFPPLQFPSSTQVNKPSLTMVPPTSNQVPPSRLTKLNSFNSSDDEPLDIPVTNSLSMLGGLIRNVEQEGKLLKDCNLDMLSLRFFTPLTE